MASEPCGFTRPARTSRCVYPPADSLSARFGSMQSSRSMVSSEIEGTEPLNRLRLIRERCAIECVYMARQVRDPSVGGRRQHVTRQAEGRTAYSAAASTSNAPPAMRARRMTERNCSTPMAASNAAINWTITPKRAYQRNIGRTLYRSAAGRTNVNEPIVRSGESEQTSATSATTARTGTAVTERYCRRRRTAAPIATSREPLGPPEAHLLFEQADAHAGVRPEARAIATESGCCDRRNQVAPPFRAVAEEIVARRGRTPRVRDDAAAVYRA